MKILKRILLVIGCLIVLLLITALFVKKEFSVEREVVINKSNQEVFDYVKLLKNQDHYNKWVMKDPNAKKEYKGTDGTVGFITTWDGNREIGKGEEEIKNIIEGQRVDLALHFIKPFETRGTAWMTTEPLAGNQTKLQWGMRGSNPYPLNLMNLFIPSMLGKDIDASLNNLKKELEK